MIYKVYLIYLSVYLPWEVEKHVSQHSYVKIVYSILLHFMYTIRCHCWIISHMIRICEKEIILFYRWWQECVLLHLAKLWVLNIVIVLSIKEGSFAIQHSNFDVQDSKFEIQCLKLADSKVNTSIWNNLFMQELTHVNEA